MSIAETLHRHTAKNGGVTVSLVSGDVVDHASGFYVGGKVPSVVFPATGYADAYEGAVDTITAQVKTGYIGSWLDQETGKVYVDASDHVEDFDSAVRIARERGELAIWDIAGGTEYRL